MTPRRLAVFVVLGLTGCGSDPPAAGPPVRQAASAGPALAGQRVVWGERFDDGSLALVERAPGGRPHVVRRIAAPHGDDEERHFGGVPGGISASADRIAYALDEATVEADGDTVTSEASVEAYDGVSGNPLVPECDSAAYISTATEGDAVALGLTSGRCAGTDATRVLLLEGEEAPRVIHETFTGVAIREVRLAGPWIAWSEDDTVITVARREDGRVVDRLRPSDFSGGRTFSAFAIDGRGRVVALSGSDRRCHYACAVWRKAGARGRARTITRRAMDGAVAMAGGRIAYLSVRGDREHRLVVADLRGRVERRSRPFPRTLRSTGDIALTRERVAWASVSEDGRRGEVRSLSASP